jgi:uncharacterized protein (DUF927 family)
MSTPYQLAEAWLRDHAPEAVLHILPLAKLKGNEMLVADVVGAEGESLHITIKGPKTGLWKDFSTGEKASKSLCKLWKTVRGIAQEDHATFFAQLASFSGEFFGFEPPGGPIDWQKCWADWTQADVDKLCKLRGYSPEFVRWLHDVNRGVGVQFGRIVFPVIAPDGALSGLHRYIDEERTLKFSKGAKVHPLVFGDMAGPIDQVHAHESRWDCYAQADITGWHLQGGIRFLCTLGAGNGKLVRNQIPPGAKVYCWEQHDPVDQNGKSPNLEWLKAVAANAGCESRKVEIPPQYKDLNDWVRAAVVTELDLDAAREAAQPFGTAGAAATPSVSRTPASTLFPAPEERPCYRLYDTDIEENGKSWEAGVYAHRLEEKTGNLIDIRILSPARAVAITQTAAGRDYGYLLEYVPHGKTKETGIRYEVIPQSLLVGHIHDLMKVLRGDLGMFAPNKCKEAIRDYLDGEHRRFSAKHPEDFWVSTKTSGWHQVGRCFVLPKKVLGEQNGVWFVVSGETAPHNCRGTLQDWNDSVAKYAKDNKYLIFSICCGFSGPLLDLLGMTGIGFHLFNDSTCGKTTVLLVSTSAWGAPEYMLSWRQTSNRLEAQAASRSDTLLSIDELSMIDANSLDACLYLLPGGVAKGRLKRDSSAADTVHWRIPILSSGECAIETYLRAHRIHHRAGQMVRVCDLPVEGDHGIFDHVPEGMSAADFSSLLRANAAQNYGTAGPAFVDRLIKECRETGSFTSELHKKLENIVRSLDISRLSAQQLRVWNSFALVGLAGELAINWEIVSWEKGSASSATADLFEAWRQGQPDSESKEHAEILKLVRDAITVHGTSQFSDRMAKAECVVQIRDRLGYWEDVKEKGRDKRIYGFSSEGLGRVTKGFDLKRVVKALRQSEALLRVKPTSKQGSVSCRIVGENRFDHLYLIDPDQLYLGGEKEPNLTV